MSKIIGSSVILRHHNSFVFEIQKQHKWQVSDSGEIQIGIGCIGGKIEASESAITALYREVEEEIATTIQLLPVKKALYVSPELVVSPLPQKLQEDNLAFCWHGYQQQQILTFIGNTCGQPHPHDLAGILLIDLPTLLIAFKNSLTIEQLQSLGGLVLENQHIPQKAIIKPVGTVDILYQVFGMDISAFI